MVKKTLDLGYSFRNVGLRDLALTQSGANAARNNERLEFIGDRVLGLVVAEMLYQMYQLEAEGELARRHAKLVSTNTLAGVARKLELEKHVRHGHMTGGRMSHILANAMEALIGAVYMDGGYGAARELVREMWWQLARQDVSAPKDPKTRLQEIVQKADNGALPEYEYHQRTGPLGIPEFSVTVRAMGHQASGEGTSKKIASINAAADMLKILAI